MLQKPINPNDFPIGISDFKKIIIIPKDKSKMGILMEFKIAQTPEDLMGSAKDALAQIQTKNYTNAFTQNDIKNVLLIGMAFCGRDVESVMAG
jgi:hypothetical protein